MKTISLLAVAVFLNGCATTTVSPRVSLMDDLRNILVDIKRLDNSTLHELVESIERQANNQLADAQRIAIIVELPRIEPPPRQEDTIPSLGGYLGGVSVPDAIRLLTEVSGLQYSVMDDERKIVIKQ